MGLTSKFSFTVCELDGGILSKKVDGGILMYFLPNILNDFPYTSSMDLTQKFSFTICKTDGGIL